MTEILARLTGPWATDVLHAPFDVDAIGTFAMVHPVREARTVGIRNVGAEVARRVKERGKN
jgi:hypothetical protein